MFVPSLSGQKRSFFRPNVERSAAFRTELDSFRDVVLVCAVPEVIAAVLKALWRRGTVDILAVATGRGSERHISAIVEHPGGGVGAVACELRRIPLQETVLLLNISYVCPEPVLVKQSF